VDGRPPARTRTAAQQAGDAAETLVADQLIDDGWTVLARNVHVGRHELDLVAVDPGPPSELVFIEVRWRVRRDYGLAEETVDHRKRRRLRTAAFTLLERGVLPSGLAFPDLPVRFDLVAVEPPLGDARPRIRHHRAAF
jgi:putative endonuclease